MRVLIKLTQANNKSNTLHINEKTVIRKFLPKTL
jgi:hypothetical protein